MFTKIGFFLFKCSTNSRIPPSYLWTYSFCFDDVLSFKVIFIPLLRNANSLILFSIIVELNLIDENIFFEGRKLILVPVFLVVSQPDLGTAVLIAISGLIVIWLSGFRMKYFLYSFFISILLVPVAISFLKPYHPTIVS